jgi:hypothetical protein
MTDYEGTTYEELCSEISDGFMGETGDLVREHAQLVLSVRDMSARIASSHQAVQEAQRLAFDTLQTSGATKVDTNEQRTPEQARLVAMYSLIHDGVKRLAGRRDIELPSLPEAQVLVIEYRQALVDMRTQRDESWANARQLQNQLASLRAEIEQLRDALADRDQELARVEDRLEAVRKIAEREQRRSWVAGAVLAALSAAPPPQPPPPDKLGCGCRQDPFCPHGDVVEGIAQPFPEGISTVLPRCNSVLMLVGGLRQRCKFSAGHRGDCWYVSEPEQPKPRPDMGLRDSQ